LQPTKLQNHFPIRTGKLSVDQVGGFVAGTGGSPETEIQVIFKPQIHGIGPVYALVTGIIIGHQSKECTFWRGIPKQHFM